MNALIGRRFLTTSARLCTELSRASNSVYSSPSKLHLFSKKLLPLNWCCQSTSRSFSQQAPNVFPTDNAKSETTSEDAETLANLTPEEEKRLKVLKLEYDYLFSSGIRVPDVVLDSEWLYLLKHCPTISSRKKHFMYLFKNEKMKLKDRAKAEANKQKREEKKAQLEQLKKEGKYEFMNTFMLFLQEQTMNRHYKGNLAYAMMNGPTLVFDFSFENKLSNMELTNLVDQIQLCHGVNKVNREPFHFHFCNLVPGSRTCEKLQKAMPNLDNLPMSVTAKNYLDCYPKESLVYLSPNSPTLLTEFNYDDVYIIGGIVDKAVEEPLTAAKAKRENIRTARFPLDQHLRWVQGSKALTLNQVVKIMLDIKRKVSWTEALSNNIPKRKFTLH